MSNMVINTNVLALNAHRSMKQIGTMQAKASGRLSSGLRINSAADDAAGLAISEKMRSQIRGLDQASKNSQDGISLLQTAEGGMQEIDNMLQRVRELIVQASNDTNEQNAEGTGDRQKIQDEVNQLVAEIDSMGNRVEFNKKRVIDGSFSDTKAQLATASGTVSRTTLQQASSVATYDALVVAQTAATTALGTAQTAVNTSIATGGAYETALGSYETAKADYDLAKVDWRAAQRAYEDAGSPIVALDPALVAYSAAEGTWTTAQTAWYDDSGANPVGDLPDFQAAKATFDGLVSTRDVANEKLTTLNAKVFAAKDTLSQDTKQLATATDRVASAQLIDATSGAKPLYFQVGANANQGMLVNIGSVKSDMLGIGDGEGNTSLNVLRSTGKEVTGLLDTLDNALTYVTTERSKLGAAQNRLEYTIKSLDISSENLSAAESRIRDTDMAKEMMNLTKANVLQQASMSMLAQANQAPQNVLQLLQ